MKKVFLAVMLAVVVWTANAQVTVTRLESTGSNPGYYVPEYIRVNFVTTYPDITTVTWEPVSSMWRATYKNNNRINQVYYNTNGVNYTVALPVISNSVPEEVITSAIDQYGASLYSITKMKAADNMDVYQVRLLENSVPKSIWMDEKGMAVTTDVYKVKVEDDKVKIKADNE